jgi:isopentenyl phosphate kinase
VDQVTALELRKGLSEISREVREENQKKVLVVHGEQNMGLVPVKWATLADQADKVSDTITIEMHAELASILHAQAEVVRQADRPVALSDIINTLVDHASIISKYRQIMAKP